MALTPSMIAAKYVADLVSPDVPYDPSPSVAGPDNQEPKPVLNVYDDTPCVKYDCSLAFELARADDESDSTCSKRKGG